MINQTVRWYGINGIKRVGAVAQVRKTDCHPTRIKEQWVLVIITDGNRTFRLYDEDFCVNKGEFFILPPHVPHYGLMEDTHEAYYVHFNADGMECPMPTRIEAGQIFLPQYGRIPDDIDCLQVLDYAMRHCMSPFTSNRFLVSQVQSVLYQISYYHQRNSLWNSKRAKYTDQILRYIQDNFSRNLYSTDYEAAFGKTYRQLNNIFLRQYGVTIKQMQIRIRINHAKLMLATGFSISEVGQKCGFDDYLYFLKVFHKVTGVTPKDYQMTFLSKSGL